VRGAAPSITCPRCQLAAPPQEAIANFVTCLGCGMSFDAAYREPVVAPRRRPPLEVDWDTGGPAPLLPPAPPPPPEANLWRQPLTPLRALVVLVLLGIAATLHVEYGERSDAARRQVDEFEREQREFRRATEQRLDAIRKSSDELERIRSGAGGSAP
jgi:hypothetical protein